MKKEVNENLSEEADKLINLPDRDLMALSLNKNERWAENYQMAINIKLRKTLLLLNKSIKELDISNRKSSTILIWLTVIIVILTILLSWQSFMAIF